MNLENSTRCTKDKLVIEDQYDYGAPPQVQFQLQIWYILCNLSFLLEFKIFLSD